MKETGLLNRLMLTILDARFGCLLLAMALLSHAAEAVESPRLPKVIASRGHGMIVLPSGMVKVFGENNRAQLGLGAVGVPVYVDDPADLPGIYDAVDGAAGGESSFVLRADGSVLAWGENHVGQLGLGAPGVLLKPWEVIKPVPSPTTIPGLARVRQLATNGRQTLALLDDGTVRAWGACGSWQLDNVSGSGGKDVYAVPFPAPVSGLAGVKAVDIGHDYALALMNNGTVKAWGRNKFGQLGDEVIDRSATPVNVPGLKDIIAISAGVEYALALRRDGTVLVWGDGGDREKLHNFAGTRSPSIHLGQDSWTAKPIEIPRLRNVTAISAGAAAIALLSDGNLRAWSYNGRCSMGTGNCAEYPVGLQTPRVSNVAAIATGFYATYFVQRDGTVLVTGSYPKSVRLNDPIRAPRVIMTREQVMQPAPPQAARVSLPVVRMDSAEAPARAASGTPSQPGRPENAPAPAAPKEDPIKQLNEGVNKLRELKGFFSK